MRERAELIGFVLTHSLLRNELPRLAAALAGRADAHAADLGLITGGERGTYYQFGLNLQTLVKPHGIDLAVHWFDGKSFKKLSSTFGGAGAGTEAGEDRR